MRERNTLQEQIELAEDLSRLKEDVLVLRELMAEGEDATDDLTDAIKKYYELIDETEMRMMLSGEYQTIMSRLSLTWLFSTRLPAEYHRRNPSPRTPISSGLPITLLPRTTLPGASLR